MFAIGRFTASQDSAAPGIRIRRPWRIAGLGDGVCADPAVEPAGVSGGDGHHGEEHQHSLDGEEARVVPPRIAVFCLIIDELLRAMGPLLGGLGELRCQPFQGAFHIGSGAPGEAHQSQHPLVP